MSLPLSPLRNEPSLIDQVHETLIMAIASGHLPVGEPLRQEQIAEQLGVSRQPVSHALQLLRHQGLLIEHGKRGLMVPPIQGEKIRQLYQVREALDALAARLAADHVHAGSAPPEDVSSFRSALQRGKGLNRQASLIERVQADVDFHQALYRLSGNPEISRTMAEQWPQFMRSMVVVLDRTDHAGTIWCEHDTIAIAVLSGDRELASLSARQHARRAGESIALATESATNTDDADATQPLPFAPTSD